MSTNRNGECRQPPGACGAEFHYAVKFVCGMVDANAAGMATPVAPGRYWTAINIHNPDKCRAAHFRWKVVIGQGLNEIPMLPVDQAEELLGPDLAVEIDCDTIRRAVPPPAPGFIKGYVILKSDVELDVVAVYSGGHAGCATLSSFHTERVPARQAPVCEDLLMPLHTGLAGWQTVAPTVGALGPVEPVSPPGAWANPPVGSHWVSQAGSDGGGADPGLRYFELCFDLCSGFTAPDPFDIQMLVDNSAMIFLNNVVIGSVLASGFSTPTTLSVDTAWLKPGRNCLLVAVDNIGGPTGFALAGMLSVSGGKCPCSASPLAAAGGGASGPTT